MLLIIIISSHEKGIIGIVILLSLGNVNTNCFFVFFYTQYTYGDINTYDI